MSEESLNCLIIDPDTGGRNRLRTALKQLDDFGTVWQVSSKSEFETKLEIGEIPEAFFLSRSLEAEDVTSILSILKENTACENSAIIMVLPSTSDKEKVVQEWFEKGADGVLFEPYSIDSISSIAEKIQHIKRDRLLARERELLGYKMKEIIGKVDVAAAVKSIGYEGSEAKKALADISEELQGLQQETLITYFSSIADSFEAASPGEKVPEEDQYKGASKNLKKRIERKMLRKVEERIDQDKQDS